MNKFDYVVEGALTLAQNKVLQLQNSELCKWHLLFGLISNPNSRSSTILQKHIGEVESYLNKLPRLGTKTSLEHLRPSSDFTEWLAYASEHAIMNKRQEITEPDLLRYIHKIFKEITFDLENLNSENAQEEVPDFLINLNEEAKKGKLDPVIGRSKEIRSLMEILGRRGKNNPVLVGPAGVGKTAIVEGMAESIVKGNVPDVLLNKIVMSLDMGQLMCGTKYRGEFEERIQKLLKYIKAQNGEIILFIDEIHQLVGAGKTEGAMDAANLLKPALARGELHCIGATTPSEYQKYILSDSALDRRFRSVMVNEPSREDTIEILMGLRKKHEIHHGIKITDDAIYSAVVLSEQYITDKNFPDKAIDLIDEASSALKISVENMPSKLVDLESEIRSKKIYAQMNKNNLEVISEIEKLSSEFNQGKQEWEKEVKTMKETTNLKAELDRLKFEYDQAERSQNFELAGQIKYAKIPEIEKKLGESSESWVLKTKDIANIIARHTGIPVNKILKSKQDQILHLNDYLKQRVFGQDVALKEICDTLLTSYAGLSDETRPLGSFLLKGPSGVGKTETAKALSTFLFETEKNMIRLDMSEYSEKHSVAKLIGSPAGYVGYDDGGILTEAVRRKPYSIILFDEIEKAHSDFSDILLQILDDGRLTDNKGRTINFKNTIIFLTTNSKDIEREFKPEVLGRIDAILEYQKLNHDIMKSLIKKQIELLNERLKDKQLTMELSDNAYHEIAKLGYDERYGARPLARMFTKYIIKPLSEKILSGQMTKGHYKIYFDENVKDLQFHFERLG